MRFPLLAEQVSVLKVLDTVDSTFSVLEREATDQSLWPDFSLLVSDHQTDGVGRLGRKWHTNSGESLALTLLFRQNLAAENFGWLQLASGAALAEALNLEFGAKILAQVKWPNDVLVTETSLAAVQSKKIAGILGRTLSNHSEYNPAIMLGIGLNTGMPESAKPVDSATSLRLLGLEFDDPTLDRLLANLMLKIKASFAMLLAGGSAAEQLKQQVVSNLKTIGEFVTATLADGEVVSGKAIALGDLGELILETNAGLRSVTSATLNG